MNVKFGKNIVIYGICMKNQTPLTEEIESIKPMRGYREIVMPDGRREELGGSFHFGTRLRRNARDISFKDLILLYLLKGSGVYRDCNGNEFQLEPGDLALRLPGKSHTIERSRNEIWMEFAMRIPRSLFSLLRDSGAIDGRITYLKPGLNMETLKKLRDFTEGLEDGISCGMGDAFLKAQEILLDFYRLGAMTESANASPNRVDSSIDYARKLLEKNLDSKIAMPEVAAKLGMGYETFRKTFADAAGMSPMNCRINAKLKRARTLLSNPDLTVKDVAYSLGYPDVSDFSRQFKKYEGMSPVKWREKRE